MSAPFGATAAQPRRTGQPVRRFSYHRGEREHRIWRPLGATNEEAKRFRAAVLWAAERYDDTTKEAGARRGGLGLSGVKVLKTLLFGFVDLRTGRLDPAIDTIAARAKLARGTVVRALARLREHGFLDWLRRTEPVDNDGAGPQVRQISNAYWLALRGRAAGIVRLILKRPPPETKTREEVAAETAAERLEAMRAPRHGRSAAEVLPADVVEKLRQRAASRIASSASSTMSQNPGSKG